VHAYSEPLSEYLRFELEAYKIQSEHGGEEIWMARRQSLPPATQAKLDDFMIFDDRRAIIPSYDNNNQLTGAVVTDAPGEIARLRELRDELLDHSVPLREFLK
jgi:hypothetical protein